MKQRKRWMAVLTVWTIALLFAAGFTSQASVSGSEMIQEKNSKYTTGAGAIAAAMESIPACLLYTSDIKKDPAVSSGSFSYHREEEQ